MKSTAADLVALIVDEKPICSHTLTAVLQSLFDNIFVYAVQTTDTKSWPTINKALAIVLVDLATIKYDCDVLSELVTRLYPAPIVAVDDRLSPSFSCIAESINCQGYISKTFEEERFTGAIRSVINGQSWFQVSDESHMGAPCNCLKKSSIVLTNRQNIVLGYIALGLTNDDIALQLGISTGTVKAHVHTILRRIGARNRTEAAIIATNVPALGRLTRSDKPNTYT